MKETFMDYCTNNEIKTAFESMPYMMAKELLENYPLEYSISGLDSTWDVWLINDMYIELTMSPQDVYVCVYDDIEGLIDANTQWLDYDEEADEFNIQEVN